MTEADPVLPARSVSDATRVFEPLASPVGSNVQLPVPLAVAMPSVVLASVIVTTAFGSPPPWISAFGVGLVPLTVCTVTAGAMVS